MGRRILNSGDQVRYRASTGKIRKGTYLDKNAQGQALVHLEGDPFPVWVPKSQVESISCNPESETLQSKKSTRRIQMPKTSKAKELRKRAQSLGISGYEDMSLEELRKAVKRAERGGTSGKTKGSKPKKTAPSKSKQKSTKPAAKKSASKKAEAPAASKATPATKRVKMKVAEIKESNPFREGSNLHTIAPLLMKGGTREDLAKELSEKVELRPYANDRNSVGLGDYDKRILLASSTLRDQYGFVIIREGRGLQGFIQAVPKSFVNGAGKTKGKAKTKK